MSKDRIRWINALRENEILQVLRIYKGYSGPLSFTAEDFKREIHDRGTVTLVAMAQDDRTVQGFMIYEALTSRINLLHIAVDTALDSATRKLVGTLMLRKLQDKLGAGRRTSIYMHVRESFLLTQLLLRDNGFCAIKCIREFYEDTGETCYVFEHKPQVLEGVPVEAMELD